MYSTKESYRDLNSIINSPDENPEQHQNMNKPALRTSIADRLDKAGLAEPEYETETDGEDKVSVIDLDDHLADRRTSYYDGSGREHLELQQLNVTMFIPVQGKDQNPKFLICQRMIMMTHLSVIVMKFISVSINRWFPMSLVHLMMYLIRLNYQMVNQLNLPLMNWLTARLQVVIENQR